MDIGATVIGNGVTDVSAQDKIWFVEKRSITEHELASEEKLSVD